MDRKEAAALLQAEGFLDELRQEMRMRLFNDWCRREDRSEREVLWHQQDMVEFAINRIVAWANESKREAIHSGNT